MILDPATLGAASILLSAVMGGLLLFSWIQNRTIAALGLWGLSLCLSAAGLLLLGLGNFTSREPNAAIMLGNAVSAAGSGLLYCGCRTFNGRPYRFLHGAAGALAWMAAWPVIRDSFDTRLVAMAVIMGSYYWLSAMELWRHAPQRLMSQRAAVVILVGATLFCAARALVGPISSGVWLEVLARRWSAEMALMVMLYIPTISVLLLSMAKERLEYESRQAALLDPLTMLPNRRAFFLDAASLGARSRLMPLSCLVFDLDGFKQINDTYGHAAGDQVLVVFARILAENLPPCAYGRLGGEEFAAILQGDAREAEQVAEKIRLAFANASIGPAASKISATVSVGYATDWGVSPEVLLSRADAALYAAKTEGRNRSVSAPPEHASGKPHQVQKQGRRGRRARFGRPSILIGGKRG